jgi:transposase
VSEIGRPSKYDPEHCETVVALGKEGKSIAQMCAAFDISRQTIDNWADEHPEFLEALSRAKVHMQAKLEEMGFDGLKSKDFNAALWRKTMEARFRDDYTERREQNNTGNVSLTFSSDDEQL